MARRANEKSSVSQFKLEFCSQQDLVELLRGHASRNYEVNGWDLVVETMSDAEILAAIKGARTYFGAVDKLRDHVSPMHGYRADIMATAF